MAEAKVKAKIELDLKISIELTVQEAHALKEIIGYGAEEFLNGYYKVLGKSYLQPYEKGVHSLFKTIKESLPQKLRDADEIIKAVNEVAKKLS